MDAAAWIDGLKTQRLGRHVVYAEAVDSTNVRAAAALAEGALPEGVAFVASRQLRGKGTGSNRWHSDDDHGLCASVVLHEPLAVQPLSFLPAIALVDVLRADYGVDAHLKWPNDVLVGERKLSGMLVESQVQPDRRLAWIVGIGVNVNQTGFGPEIRDLAVSMRMVTGRTHSRVELFQRLMLRMERLYDSREDLVPMWRERTEMLGKRIAARRQGERMLVTVVGVSPQGHLLVVRDDGEPEEWVARVEIE